MKTELPTGIEEVRRAVQRVCGGRPVASVDLFGSVAHGNATASSDVDLLIQFEPDYRVGLFEMGALAEELRAALGRPVDLVSRPAIERSTNPYRRRAILSSCVNVYAR
jgi:predicted nucleotidyltransferase